MLRNKLGINHLPVHKSTVISPRKEIRDLALGLMNEPRRPWARTAAPGRLTLPDQPLAKGQRSWRSPVNGSFAQDYGQISGLGVEIHMARRSWAPHPSHHLTAPSCTDDAGTTW